MKKNCFSAYHPAVVFLYFAGAAGLCMCSLHPYYVLVSYLCGAVLLGISCGLRRVFRQVLATLAVVAVTAAVNGLTGGLGLTVLFYLGGTPVTWESVFYGLCSGGMLAAVLQWFACYQRIMTGDKFLELFGRGFPTVSMMLSMVFRYIPDMLGKGREIRAAQKALTGGKSGGKREQMKEGVRLASVLMNWSMENSMETADSMQAREYGKGPRSRYIHERMSRGDYRAALILAALLIVSAFGVFGKASEFVFYPFLGGMEAGICFLPVYGLYLLIPALLEGKELIWWMRLR
ncbi:energy-coupling factor transporter transmembrane component T [Cuneatibacter caecimuris]|uniref:Energy-coupling factor transport system permease protein n=1 Tax=Cuneatibacter caecimuris TaxID=1796618 RepID=A0A4Q7P2G3_9FIRM|nr:energy-coupling factor transporter transmembrane component T [Cuneatibacter caecimuris]RZS94086.1 energy-coupling factor transport system permease protein [Cuneatibacter caecimuris]